MYEISRTKLPSGAGRTAPFYFPFPYTKYDTTIYKLPAGFVAEKLPEPTNLSFESGTYHVQYAFSKESAELRIIAKLELKDYVIPAAKLPAARKFFEEVVAEYGRKIVVERR